MTKERKEVVTSETEVARLEGLIGRLAKNVLSINSRIDRIVAALGKSKSVKGM